MWESEVTANVDFGGTIGVISAKETYDGTDLMVGIGENYAFTNSFAVRVEYEYLDIDKTEAGAGDYGTISANAILSF